MSSTTRKLSTIICWQDDAGEDRETCANIVYVAYPGFPGDRIDPPEEPSIEIQNITVTSGDPLDGRFWTDDEGGMIPHISIRARGTSDVLMASPLLDELSAADRAWDSMADAALDFTSDRYERAKDAFYQTLRHGGRHGL